MIWEAWVTLAVVLAVMVALARGWGPPVTVLLAAAGALVLLNGVSPGRFLDPEQLAGQFGNSGLVTIGLLFVMVAGLKQTGAMSWVLGPVLGRPRSLTGALTRLMLPVAGVSALVNNTPVVAMFLPVVSDWCKKTRLSPSKLMIPLSYAAVLGGMVTLIGTSTNLIVNGLVIEQRHHVSLGMFDPMWVGLPCAVVGLVYLLTLGRWLLPDRQNALSTSDARQYTVEMFVDNGSALSGQSIEKAGLRQLTGLYLAEIQRGDEILPAVDSTQKLCGGDRLIFVGVVESIVDLQRVRGLSPATDQVFKLDAPRAVRRLIEAVVSDHCPLVGQSIRQGRFRGVYQAAVIAVARGGKRLNQKIGDIILCPGDTLLLEAHPSFAQNHRNSRDFYLVSLVDDSAPPVFDKAWIALAVLAAMVIAVTAGWVSMLAGALVAAVLMVLTGCCNMAQAIKSVDWQVLVVIGAALGLGVALQQSTLAASLAGGLMALVGNHPLVMLAVVYGVTLILTELVTNNAAAVLVFPIAMAAADRLGLGIMPFVMAVMIAASAGFATPLGYQTHLMVYGPGGYRFSDYLKVGLPLDVLIGITAVTLIPWVWGW